MFGSLGLAWNEIRNRGLEQRTPSVPDGPNEHDLVEFVGDRPGHDRNHHLGREMANGPLDKLLTRFDELAAVARELRFAR